MGLFDSLFGKKKSGDDPRERRRNASVRLKQRIAKVPGATPSGEQNPISDEDTAEDITATEERIPSGLDINLDGLDSLPGGTPATKTPANKDTATIKTAGQGRPQPRPADSTAIIKPDEGEENTKKPSGRFVAPGSQISVTLSGRQRRRTSIAKKQIGNLLVGAQAISEKHLEKALDIQEKQGGLLGQILVGMKICEKSQIGAALNKQRTITSIPLEEAVFDPEALAVVTREFCERHRLIPFEKIGTILCIAMANVLDSASGNELRDVTQLKVKKFDATWSEISAAIEKQYAQAKPTVTNAADETMISGVAAPDIIGDGESVIDLDDADLDGIIIELPDEKPATAKVSETDHQDVDHLDDDDEELEELDEVDDAPVPAPAPTPTPAAALAVILPGVPVSPKFLNAVLRDGAVHGSERWRRECAGTDGVPALPSIRTV